jgi:transposase
MYRVEVYAEVRRSVYVEGLSERAAARRFGLARETVRKMLRYSVPPGYRRARPVRCPKLDGFTGVIDQILGDDRQRPKKQRHTAKRIWERLRAEHAFTGGYTIVKDYVRAKTLGGQEMFVPLVHPPGDAQADFGEALVVVAGVECKAHYLVVDLPHSDDAFVKAFPAETTEAFCDGHNAAFSYFGGVPRCRVYDNTKLAVARILGDGTRQRTRVFSELQSHYLFDARFGRPGKGNDKGKVEGLVGYARRNFFVPVPRFSSWEALNADSARQCRARRGHRLRRHTETIGERFARDRDALLPLPPVPYDACDRRTTRVTSLSLVRYRLNDYSVPTAYGHRQVVVKGYVNDVVIVCGSDEIARHRRSYEREALIFDPRHYLALLERKTGAFDQAAPLAGWALPEAFLGLRRRLEARLGKAGTREYVQVLRLLEDFRLDHVSGAVGDALALGAIGFDAVKHLVLCRLDHRPPRLDLAQYPHLPVARVAMTAATDYLALLGVGAE